MELSRNGPLVSQTRNCFEKRNINSLIGPFNEVLNKSYMTYLKVYTPGTRDFSCNTGESAPELIILFLSFRGPLTSSHLYWVILSSSELSANEGHQNTQFCAHFAGSSSYNENECWCTVSNNYVELSLRFTHKGAKKVGDIVSELAKKKK